MTAQKGPFHAGFFPYLGTGKAVAMARNAHSMGVSGGVFFRNTAGNIAQRPTELGFLAGAADPPWPTDPPALAHCWAFEGPSKSPWWARQPPPSYCAPFSDSVS